MSSEVIIELSMLSRALTALKFTVIILDIGKGGNYTKGLMLLLFLPPTLEIHTQQHSTCNSRTGKIPVVVNLTLQHKPFLQI